MNQLTKDIWFFSLLSVLLVTAVAGVIWALIIGRADIALIIGALGPVIQYALGLMRKNNNKNRTKT